MYIDMSSVDELMKSTIEKKLYSNNKAKTNYSASFYILEEAAVEMLDHIVKRKKKSSDILESVAASMLEHIKNKKNEVGDLNIFGSKIG